MPDKKPSRRRHRNPQSPGRSGSDAASNAPLQNLGLKKETLELLTHSGLKTARDLASKTEKDLYKIRKFNKKNLIDVQACLKSKGLALKPTPPPKPKPEPEPTDPTDEEPIDPTDIFAQIRHKARAFVAHSTKMERPRRVRVAPEREERDKYVKIGMNGKWGFRDRVTKAQAVPMKYDEVFAFHEDLCCVQLGDKFGYINRAGEEVIPLEYDCASSFSEGLACVFKGETCGYIDKDGNAVIDFAYDAGTPMANGECRVKKAGRWGELHIEDPENVRWII